MYGHDETIAFLTDLMDRRGSAARGHNPARFVELYGGTVIEPTAFAPDPVTHRAEYYYNAVDNMLFRRVWSRRNYATGELAAHWQPVVD